MKKTQPPLLALRKEAMGQAGRAASPGRKRQRNEFSSRASRRECGPADSLDFCPVRPISDC